jgi:hypothetical protein
MRISNFIVKRFAQLQKGLVSQGAEFVLMERGHPWPQAGRLPAFPEVANKSCGHFTAPYLFGLVVKACIL